MSWTGFDWDDANRKHLARHKVSPSEFEEVMRNGPTYVEEEERNGELRITEIGYTKSLRALIVVWTPRKTLCRPVTAYDADREDADEFFVGFYEK